MATHKIGVIVDSFRVGVKEGIKKAQEVGAEGVQIYGVGENASDNLSPSDRKELLNYIKDHGLLVSAICVFIGHWICH